MGASETNLVEVDPGKKIRYGSGKFGTGTSSRIRTTGNLFSVGTGRDIYVSRIGMYLSSSFGYTLCTHYQY